MLYNYEKWENRCFGFPENESMNMNEENIISVGDRVRLYASPHGLAWGTDAYLLAAYIKKSRRACELGCGCGVISLLAAAHGRAESVSAIEILPDMADLSRRNVALNGLDGRVRVHCADIRSIRPEDIGGRVDTVFANPPYIAHPGTENADAAAQAARHELHGGIGDFCAAAARLLNYRGSFFVVFRPDRLADLFEALRRSKLEPKRMTMIHPDAASAPSLVLVEARLGAAPKLDVEAPLFFYRAGREEQPRVMSARTQAIYDTCSWQ